MNNTFNFFPYILTQSNLTSLSSEKKRKREYDVCQPSPSLSGSGSPFLIGTPVMSETTTESGVDEYISINGGQNTVRIIDAESKEAEDSISLKRFFVATGGELFYNRAKWHAHSLKTSIELAVCGGNLYALLMGDGQPEYCVGKGEVDEDLDDDMEPVYYRVGSKIDFLAEGEDIFSFNESVKGLIFSLMISYFLGDADISNVVGVADEEGLLIRRLDPEFCFSSYFSEETHNNYNSILKELNFIFKLNTDNHELTQQELQNLIEKSEIDFFKECFMKKFLMHAGSLKILSSEARNHEFLSALKKITETPFCQYEHIIDKSISNENIRMQLKNTFKKRLEIFSKIYQELVEVVEPKNINPPETPVFLNKR